MAKYRLQVLDRFVGEQKLTYTTKGRICWITKVTYTATEIFVDKRKLTNKSMGQIKITYTSTQNVTYTSQDRFSDND